jgi:hypothetical protein
MLAHPSENLFMFVEGKGFALPADPFSIPHLTQLGDLVALN